MVLKWDCRKVANVLKKMVNSACEEGFEWYKDVPEEAPNVLDLVYAIEVLEKTEPKALEVTE